MSKRELVQRARQQLHFGPVLLVDNNVIPEIPQLLSWVEAGSICHPAPNGDIDYSVETINGQQIRRKKINRPKALCFDYLILKDAFGIDLETEIMTDVEGV